MIATYQENIEDFCQDSITPPSCNMAYSTSMRSNTSLIEFITFDHKENLKGIKTFKIKKPFTSRIRHLKS